MCIIISVIPCRAQCSPCLIEFKSVPVFHKSIQCELYRNNKDPMNEEIQRRKNYVNFIELDKNDHLDRAEQMQNDTDKTKRFR